MGAMQPDQDGPFGDLAILSIIYVLRSAATGRDTPLVR
jgi:hypothetical protein